MRTLALSTPVLTLFLSNLINLNEPNINGNPDFNCVLCKCRAARSLALMTAGERPELALVNHSVKDEQLKQPAGPAHFLPPWPPYCVPITSHPVLTAIVVLGL